MTELAPHHGKNTPLSRNGSRKIFMTQKKIREMGKALGADGVIYGKYNTVEERLELHGIIFSVIDGEVVEEQHASAPLSAEMFEKINEVSDNLAKKIKDLFVPSDRGALTRSLLFPGWGHYYKQRNGWGNFWAISGGTAIAFTATMGTMFVVMKNQYDTYNPQHYRNTSGGTGLYDANAAQAEFDRLEASANQFGQLALIGGAVTAGIWLGAMLHAYFIEPDMGNAAPPKQAQASPLQWQLGADHSRSPACAAQFRTRRNSDASCTLLQRLKWGIYERTSFFSCHRCLGAHLFHSLQAE
jgi:hypothetical protein